MGTEPPPPTDGGSLPPASRGGYRACRGDVPKTRLLLRNAPPNGETAARVGAAAGTEQSRTRGTCGGAQAARGHRERRAEDSGTSAPALRGAVLSRDKEGLRVLRGAPGLGLRERLPYARPRPRCAGSPASSHGALPPSTVGATEARSYSSHSRRSRRRRGGAARRGPAVEGQRGAEGAASGLPPGGSGRRVGGEGGRLAAGPGPTGEGENAGGRPARSTRESAVAAIREDQ